MNFFRKVWNKKDLPFEIKAVSGFKKTNGSLDLTLESSFMCSK